MALDTDLQARSTHQPREANLRVVTDSKTLTEDQWNDLGIDLYSTWIAAQTSRSAMDENLRAYTALYEMEVEQLDAPWVDAANLVLPIIPSEIDAMLAYIAGQVFVERLVIVTAADDDSETQRLAPLVERYYNSELRRIRSDGKTPIEQLLTILHLSLRDGAGPCDVLFTQRKEPKLIISEQPKIVDGVVVTVEGGLPATERVMQRIEETISEVSIIPGLLKETYLTPAESTSLHSALGIHTVLWMTEKEMKEKVADGVFDADAVEEVLNRLQTGVTDVSSDPAGSYDKDTGGQVNVGQGQGSVVSEFFANRGPARIIRTYSEQFDMNADGIAERNVFWHAPDYPKLVGWSEYEYVSGEFPKFMFSPFPRPDRPYGYSLAERLADITADACAGRNQRRNYIDLELSPVVLQRAGDAIRDKDRAVFPGAPWMVEDVDKSVRYWSPNPLSSDSFNDDAQLERYISKLTGQGATATGAQSSSRRSATESRQQALAQSVRANLVAMQYRYFLRAVLQFWHKLNKQYLGASNDTVTTETEQGTVTLDPGTLGRNFNIDISGASDPVDAPARRQELMGAMGILMKFPEIMNNAEHRYNMLEAFLDTFQWAGVERFIGTPEEARQREVEEKQQRDAQAAAAQQQQHPQPGAPHPPKPPGGQA